MTDGVPQRGDRGSAGVWLLACGALLLAVAAVVVVRGLAVLARHRAESAADLAALAAAGQIGVSTSPCRAAGRIADANEASVARCSTDLDTDARSGTVVVRLIVSVHLPVVGVRIVTASARAARLPAS